MAATSDAVRPDVTLLDKPKDAQRHISLRDQAYHAIKRLIITTGLRPGEILSEPALSTQLDIGRTPIRQAIDRPFTVEGHTCSVAVSIGIALYPNDGDDAETLTRRADEAMYRAKTAGRGPDVANGPHTVRPAG